MDTVHDRVRRGARFLDWTPKTPGDWRKKIDVIALSMKNGRLCVLGQLFGHYDTALQRLGLTQDAALEFGFDGHLDEYSELTEAWRSFLQSPGTSWALPVGTRVRVLSATYAESLVGRTGTVVAMTHEAPVYHGRPHNNRVRLESGDSVFAAAVEVLGSEPEPASAPKAEPAGDELTFTAGEVRAMLDTLANDLERIYEAGTIGSYTFHGATIKAYSKLAEGRSA